MPVQSYTKRPRSVKAEFDPDFRATPVGGAVLAEKAMRSLGLRRLIAGHLPARSEMAKFSTLDAVYPLMAALLLGGRGLGAAELFREDTLAAEIFGLEKGAPSASTMYRALCDLSGLVERSEGDVYKPAGRRIEAMDMLGEPRRPPKTRRVVPEQPEAADPGKLAQTDGFLGSVARRCHKSLPAKVSRLLHWWVVFGDATGLEVEGNCFDAARNGYEKGKIIRWITLMLGPLIVAQRLVAGNCDEGTAMPALIRGARETIREMTGSKGKALSLLDAAYFEKAVIEAIDECGWDFIVCANQQRVCLERIAAERPEAQWDASGADAARGWAESQVCCFSHLPGGWGAPVSIVARRWKKEGELPEWHYAFVATRIEPKDLPQRLQKRYCATIWSLYGTKQGRENHYKTPLRDQGLHHPPSGRLGVDQAYYCITAAASNIAMVLRYAVAPKAERGIELWRLRQRYFQIAGYLARGARALTVRLAGASVGARRQALWREAFAAAGRL